MPRDPLSAMVEFVVRGTPKSQQAGSRKRWQEKVQRAAPPSSELLTGPLRLRIDFFFDGSAGPDTDNIIKPIQDALEDIVYGDDETVVDVCARKIDLQRLPSLVAVSPTLLTALAEPSGDFVYIRVATAKRRLEFA